MRDEAVSFTAFSPPMASLISTFADTVEGEGPAYVVSSANPRIVGGAPSKNPRYLQQRPDRTDARATAVAELSQRLVRRICTGCKEPIDVPPSALTSMGFAEREIRSLRLFRGRGCERCSNTGYKGRVGLYEVMEINDDIRELILSGASAVELRTKAIENGGETLSPWGTTEEDYDTRRGMQPDRRLGCSATVRADVVGDVPGVVPDAPDEA